MKGSDATGGPAAPRRAAPGRRRGARALALLLPALLLGGCETLNALNPLTTGPQPGQAGYVTGFLGGVAADEPRAALVAREVLSAGGSAGDAATAAALTMAVTLPSRVGLGGGGACLGFDPRRNLTEAVLFLPGGRAAVPAGADRPAAVPLLARGLYALQARFGRRPFEELMAPAEQLARFGTPVSRALAADLAAVRQPLLADPGARAVFTGRGGNVLGEGDALVQGDLATTLAALRTSGLGIGDFHQGALARRIEEASALAGGGLTMAELRAALPRVVPPLQVRPGGGDIASFLPPPADGGLAAAVGFRALLAGLPTDQAAERGLAAARAWRDRRGEPEALLNAASLPPNGGWPALPASAALTVFDRGGQAVTCAFTMNNLFGTGRMAPGLGFLLAAAPGIGAVEPPLLAAVLQHNPNFRAFRFATAGTGQLAAPAAVAGVLMLQTRQNLPLTDAVARGAAEPGRVEAAACTRYLPGGESSCVAVTDPRGAGVALGAVDR
ncbi:gamma-glutamyltransferase family protein [Roseomonas sp. NAR14]|uniref:Gamma-glutamyltransferase family protein n=1 Tax=Roseomonas acroporae TaxID=2937791 RepID=A0A9X1Y456_9PROT|nr:gamma-glutamyltransferase [Roseomonas acroporae]MCK8783078.1 gamma-glutamyltransferase family protein [Roseomonas acroporae]